jgi:hypothetical protein
MKNLIKYLNTHSAELKIPNSLLPNLSLDIDPVSLYIIASKLSKIADDLKQSVRDDVVEHVALSGKTTVNFDGVDVTLARVANYDYPPDTFIQTWNETLDQHTKKVKELKEAISNRQKLLVDEGMAVELEPTYRITVK